MKPDKARVIRRTQGQTPEFVSLVKQPRKKSPNPEIFPQGQPTETPAAASPAVYLLVAPRVLRRPSMETYTRTLTTGCSSTSELPIRMSGRQSNDCRMSTSLSKEHTWYENHEVTIPTWEACKDDHQLGSMQRSIQACKATGSQMLRRAFANQ